MRKYAYLASLLFIFVIPMEKMIFIPGLGSLARIIGLLVLALWITSVAGSGQIRALNAFHIFVVVFVAWNAASFFWSLDSESTLFRMQTWFQLGFLVILIWDLYTTPEALRAALQAYILGAYVSIVGTLINLLQSSQFVYGRYSASGLHVVDLGLVLAMGMPMAWYLIITKEHQSWIIQRLRFINIAYLPAASIAIALTGSRGAMIAAVPTLFFVLATLRRLRPLFRILFFVVLIGGLFLAERLVPQSSLDRLGTTYTELTEGGDLSGRTGLWSEGIELFSEHSILGIGSNAFKNTAILGQVAHNSFLSIAVESGVIGISLFITILGIVTYHALIQPREERWFGLTLLMCWVLGASTLSFEHHKPTWLLFSFIMVASAMLPEGKPPGAKYPEQTSK